jgi:hypothetical protein
MCTIELLIFGYTYIKKNYCSLIQCKKRKAAMFVSRTADIRKSINVLTIKHSNFRAVLCCSLKNPIRKAIPWTI